MIHSPSNPAPKRKRLQGPVPGFCASLSACLTLASGAIGATSASAQDSFHVSLSSPTTLGTQLVDDSSLVRADASGLASPILTEGHWQALLGSVPGDVDAFSRRIGFDPESAASLVFSFLSDTAGFSDGDVLTLDPTGGLQLLFAEEDLLAALGLVGGNLDVDALDLSRTDQVYLSLQNDLPGTVLGDVQDGDVLVFDPITQGISLYLTEDEIQGAFTLATGSLSAIGDVLGICFRSNEFLFSIQSPSAYDGAVFSMAQGGILLRDEAMMGMGGGELSALSLAQGSELPCFALGQLSASPGDTLDLEVHGQPNTMYVALFGGNTGQIDFSRRPGWGTIAMSITDTWLISTLSMGNLPFVVTDALGDFSGSVRLPSTALYGLGFGNEEGWSFQMLEVPGLKLSAPYRVLKN